MILIDTLLVSNPRILKDYRKIIKLKKFKKLRMFIYTNDKSALRQALCLLYFHYTSILTPNLSL